MTKRPAVLALAAVLGMWLWQFATVRYNYGGNWTALFCTAPDWPRPAFLASENVYTFPGSLGYDGQMYHIIAHDPLMRRGGGGAMDDPALRYRRILVPALAWALALGHDSAVHAAYVAVILGFVFLGVYWLARAIENRGRHPAWGLMFVMMPATLVSMDRMTVDVALAALTAGFVLYCEPGPGWKVLVILACAALTRETGLLLTAGYGVLLLSRRRFADLLWTAATVLPAILWYVHVSGRTPPETPTGIAGLIPMAGWIERVAHPAVYSLPRWQALAAVELDYVALAGVALLLGHSAWLAWTRRWNARAAVIYVFAAAIVFIGSRSVWEDAFGYGRVVTPLMLLLAAEDPRPRLAFTPVVLVDARIGLNFLRQIVGIASHLLK